MRKVMRRWPAQELWMWAALALPLLVALAVLSSHQFSPLLDLAMTELRVRDVGGPDTPLIGLPGRIGRLPEQGSHPGPLSFWLLAPVYRLFGATAFGLEVGTVVLHLVAVSVALWTGKRVAGTTGLIAVAVMIALLMRGYGALLLVQPWNPYLPLLAWVVVLLAVWAVLAGDERWLLAIAIAGSFAAQTHVSYVLMCGGLFAVACGTVIARMMRGPPSERRSPLVWLATSFAAGAILWIAPVAEQLTSDGDGNIAALLNHFTSPDEDPIGIGNAVSMLLRHLNVVAGFATTASSDLTYAGADEHTARLMDGSAVEQATRWPAVVLLVLWSVAVVVTYRAGARRWNALNATIAAALALALINMSRIFGTRWYYLTLWMWPVTLMMVTAVLAAAVLVLRHRGFRIAPTVERALPVVGLALVVASSAAFAVEALDAEHPDQRDSDVLEAVVGRTYDAIVEGVGAADGPDGRYAVRFQDAHMFVSKFFGLVNELERRGLDVGGDSVWRVPLADRIVDEEVASAEIYLASGVFIKDVRQRPGAIEVASADLRTPKEVERYRALRIELIDELEQLGLNDLVGLVDTNVFGLSYDSRVSERTRELAVEMLALGNELAVFIVPTEQ